MVIFGCLNQRLHIVSFDVPYPPNYGGVMDVFYKLVWLHKAGVKIHLHCFTYGREPSTELTKYCEKVHYYRRKTGLFSNLSLLPYTVRSRRSAELRKNLLADTWPILFEVLHTCYLMNDPQFIGRRMIYRHSNIEHDYYKGLARSESSLFRKLYLRIEAFKLMKFESTVARASLILAVNQSDREYFLSRYPEVPCHYLPSFHPQQNLPNVQAKEKYILFHGNLSTSENYEAAKWLVEQVFSKINEKLIIAGLNPPETLKHQIKKYSTISLVENPDESAMGNLISGAQLHVLYTEQATGLKLKLLNVLQSGKFVLCNPAMLEGTGLHENRSLKLATDPFDFINQIKVLMNTSFDEKCQVERKESISEFDNEKNAQKLIKLVFN